ncbi:MAG TPA: thioredoxin family protein [Anaeromyxobacteraceae bacterium]|nr:thioredoxin family protein [Anaeromyxobacteraceae bacterium]
MKLSGKMAVLAVVAAAIAAVVVLRARDAGAPQGVPQVAQGQPLPRLVDVGAGKCVPCKAMAPILEELRAEYAGRMEVRFIDVWKEPEAASPYGVSMIPTQIFFSADGRELARHVGFMSREEILAQWRAAGVRL